VEKSPDGDASTAIDFENRRCVGVATAASSVSVFGPPMCGSMRQSSSTNVPERHNESFTQVFS
jgi:hypothetical protein